MTTDTLSSAARMTLQEVLTDLGFPSVADLAYNAIAYDYYSTIADAWGACDQTDDDARACDAARILIDYAFNA